VVLFVSAAFADFARFSGRSADLLYSPNDIQDDSFLFLMDKYSGSTNQQITETNVADLISYLVGTPILNPTSQRENFPQGNIFETDRANVMIVIDGVGSELLNSLPQLKTLQQSGQRYQIVKQFYPQDNVASLTTLATGHGPSIHGVVNKTWISTEGKMIAFSTLETSPQVVNIADVVSNTFQGKSLIVSASADSQMTSIFSVNQFANKHLATNNYAYHFCDKIGAFKTTGAALSDIPATSEELLATIASQNYPLRNKGDSIKYFADTKEMLVVIPSENIHIAFDMDTTEDLHFFAELNMAQAIIRSVRTNLKESVEDNAPDMYTFAFSSIKGLQAKYGVNSQNVKAAILLLDGVVSQIAADMKDLYGRVAVEVAFMGVPAYTRIQKNIAFEQFKADIHTVLKSNTKNMGSFPAVYIGGINNEAACQVLMKRGLSAFNGLELQCASTIIASSRKNLEQTAPTTNNFPLYAEFNIILFSSILLIISVYAAAYALFSMSSGADNFLRAPPMKSK